jgi:phage portal protein BeeE
MPSAITKALNRTKALRTLTTQHVETTIKAGGRIDLTPGFGDGGLGAFRSQQKNRAAYASYRGWIYSAVHALASASAERPVSIYKSKAKSSKKTGKLNTRKALDRRIRDIETKQKDDEEAVLEHPVLDRLTSPNPMQGHYQFVYSFVASMQLTGWGFLVFDDSQPKGELPYVYSVPTTWVTPIHEKGPFAEFKIADPSNPNAAANQEPIPRGVVEFAYFPDPSNPLQAMAPASSQAIATQIDENIQTSQSQFFENGMFPSALVTVGRDPHPDVPAGVRPRLTAQQRRQVYAAIRKVSQGVANYGQPVILDGLIESVERLSASQNELGWEKSEKAIRTRILSAFGVHPFILGEEMVGSYAQAAIVETRFGKRVNVCLRLLSEVMTGHYDKDETQEDGLEVLYEPFEADDPQMRQGQYDKGRANGDVSRNEYRAFIGLPKDDSIEDVVVDKTIVTQVLQIAQGVAGGKMSRDQGIALLTAMGIPKKKAEDIAGEEPPETPAMGLDPMGGQGAAEGMEGPEQAVGGLEQPENAEMVDDFDSEIDKLLESI